MSKRMKVFVAVLVAILMLTVGGAATVMADDGSTATENETGRKGLQARVAEILGIPSDNLTSAFEQAQQEMREEAFIRYLDKAVEEGLITQQEADEIIEWLEQRPESLDRLSPRCFFGKALHNRHMWSAHRGWSEEALSQAMERGLITEEKAGMIMERWQNRLETQNRLFLRARIHQAICGRQMMAVPRGWQQPGLPELADQVTF